MAVRTIIELPRGKTYKMTVRPAKTQISLGIFPVWSDSSLCALRVAKAPSFLHATESTLGAHAILLVLSWGGSIMKYRGNIYAVNYKAQKGLSKEGRKSIICLDGI